ncbi:MAG: NAD-dependent epimerase/dehydratase family protein [Thermoplasmatales archaeon]|nr:NAD-dependent epimerase/dehydratase family protein [Thermoplasmatales archaeon]
MKVLVTGGAGFIGSHLVEHLLERGYEVRCVDNFSSGKIEFIEKNIKEIELIKGDLLSKRVAINAVKDCEIVFHLAANPDVRAGEKNTKSIFENNVIATYNLLEGMRKEGVKKIIFTSSSAVYGDAEKIPTPEDYSPLIPISIYGATKLACEAMICSYCHTFDMQTIIYRFANVVGGRSTHGVIYDFIKKLQANREKLEILGDGKQRKSYLYIDDCIDAIFHTIERWKGKVEIYNIGSLDSIEVKEIADIISEEMNVKPEYYFTGGIDGRGWKGDVKFMTLDISKIMRTGWKPKYSSKEAVQLAAKWLINEIK